MRTVLIKSVSKEIWAIFFTCLFVFIFIILSTKLIDIRTDLVVNYRIRPDRMFTIILHLLPNIILFSMPVACLMSVLLAFIRMSGDNEIIALNTSGVSLYQILSPVVLFSLICLIISGFLTFHYVPQGNRSYKHIIEDLIKSRADFEIKERIFYDNFDDFVIYVNSYSPKERLMKDVFLVYKREQPARTILAEEGRIIMDEKSGILTIQLTECLIFAGDIQGYVKNYPITVDLEKLMSSMLSGDLKPKEMYFSELLNELNNPEIDAEKANLIRLTLYEMFSIPLSIFLIGMIGAPLGAHVKAQGRTKGIVISLFIFLGFYVFMSGIRYVCEIGIISPSIGVWIPVFFLLLTGIYLLVRSAQNRTFGFRIFKGTGIFTPSS